MSKTYIAKGGFFPSGDVLVVDGEATYDLDPCFHLARHSPDGFAWGSHQATQERGRHSANVAPLGQLVKPIEGRAIRRDVEDVERHAQTLRKIRLVGHISLEFDGSIDKDSLASISGDEVNEELVTVTTHIIDFAKAKSWQDDIACPNFCTSPGWLASLRFPPSYFRGAPNTSLESKPALLHLVMLLRTPTIVARKIAKRVLPNTSFLPNIARLLQNRATALVARQLQHSHLHGGCTRRVYRSDQQAQLSLALLCDALGDEDRAQRLYQRFKSHWVAHQKGDRGWELSQADIIRWADSVAPPIDSANSRLDGVR